MKEYKMIAHRGLFNNNKGIPENSIRAFELAIENSYAIELDVRITKDKKLVVFHDKNLKRMIGIDSLINECNLEYLEKLKLLNTEYSIPTFEEVLRLVDGKVPLLIEIKNEGNVGILESKVMQALSKYNGKFMIESFNPLSLYWIRKRYSNVVIGQLSSKSLEEVSNFVKRFILKNMLLNIIVKPDFIAYDINYLTERFVEKYHKKGILVYGWTAKNKEEIEKFSNMCDGVIFEKK